MHKLLDLVHGTEAGWLEGRDSFILRVDGLRVCPTSYRGDGIYFRVRSAPGFTDADFAKGRRVRFTVREGFGRNAGKLAVGTLVVA